MRVFFRILSPSSERSRPNISVAASPPLAVAKPASVSRFTKSRLPYSQVDRNSSETQTSSKPEALSLVHSCGDVHPCIVRLLVDLRGILAGASSAPIRYRRIPQHSNESRSLESHEELHIVRQGPTRRSRTVALVDILEFF